MIIKNRSLIYSATTTDSNILVVLTENGDALVTSLFFKDSGEFKEDHSFSMQESFEALKDYNDRVKQLNSSTETT